MLDQSHHLIVENETNSIVACGTEIERDEGEVYFIKYIVKASCMVNCSAVFALAIKGFIFFYHSILNAFQKNFYKPTIKSSLDISGYCYCLFSPVILQTLNHRRYKNEKFLTFYFCPVRYRIYK